MTPALPKSCLDNHACFRVLLQAMSRPGKILSLPDSSADNFESSLIRLLDAVLDQQASCHLVHPDADLEQKITDQTGARFTNAETADFILAPDGDSLGTIVLAKRGELNFPDRGATILFGVENLANSGEENSFTLSGPGIRDSVQVSIAGLNQQELMLLKEVNCEFPLGVDSIFLDRRNQLMCIPRSTRIGV